MGLTKASRLYKAPAYVRIFVRHHKTTGPFPCTFCGDDVRLLDGGGRGRGGGGIHHLDHDHENNTLENLAPMHRSCHTAHHHDQRVFTPEHRARISEALKAKGIRPPKRDQHGEGRGVPKSEAHKAAIAEGQRRRWARLKETRG